MQSLFSLVQHWLIGAICKAPQKFALLQGWILYK